MFTDDVKILVRWKEVKSFELSPKRAWRWSVDWDLYLNIDKCWHITVGSSLESTLPFDGASSYLREVGETRDFAVVVDSSFIP